jgi:hypothetical protein
LPANADTVRWGYFSKKLKPQVKIESDDFITIGALTHHADDGAERMVKGDPSEWSRKISCRIPSDDERERGVLMPAELGRLVARRELSDTRCKSSP